MFQQHFRENSSHRDEKTHYSFVCEVCSILPVTLNSFKDSVYRMLHLAARSYFYFFIHIAELFPPNINTFPPLGCPSLSSQ